MQQKVSSLSQEACKHFRVFIIKRFLYLQTFPGPGSDPALPWGCSLIGGEADRANVENFDRGTHGEGWEARIRWEEESFLVPSSWYTFFFFLVAAQQSMQDLSSQTRAQTHAPCRGSMEP